MVAFPSEPWFDEAGARLRDDTDLAERSRGVHLVLQQTVSAPGGDVVWHLEVDDGTVALRRGPAADPTVTFTCDPATSEGVHLGTTSAQSAFMAGRLRVGGDVGALLRHQDLVRSLSELLGPLRSEVA